MPIGPMIRRFFGPYERSVAESYRRIFVDLDELGQVIKKWVPEANAILEVGCGEGAMTERLARLYPHAEIVGIDINERVGRLYEGDRSRVRFLKQTVSSIALEQPHSFSLVLLADVLHHVPVGQRSTLLRDIASLLDENGTFIFKEWIGSDKFIHDVCEASDRYLTGDDVSYCSEDEAVRLLKGAFEDVAIRDKAFVAPWSNNQVWLVRRSIR